MTQKIAAMILAAGASSRMGRSKPLLPWGPETVLEHLLSEINGAGIDEILVVAGANGAEITELLQGRAEVCEHPQWALGMGSSIRTGISCFKREMEQPDAVLILLADQPLVTSAYIKQMLTSFGEGGTAPVASAYKEGPGVPALFPAAMFGQLESLPDHRGARSLLQGQTVRVLDPGGAGQDMDTPEAYRKLLKQAGLTEL